MPASHWAAGYIAYCVNAGIINGMGDGTFAPDSPVTGLQFAKMLLCALGYNANDEYVNDDWAITVSKDALRLGVFEDNLGGATNTPATREECALYAFNTVAGANNNTGIKKVSYSALLGGYITSGSVGADAADASKGQTIADDFKLDKNEEDEDAFGRMTGHNWYVKNKGNVISGFYADEDNLKASYSAKVTGADIASLLGKTFIDDVKDNGTYEVWVNGVEDNTLIPISKLKSTEKDALTYNSYKAGDKIGNGTETLVYAGVDDNDDSWLRIVVVDTYLAKVTNVRAATSTREAEVTVSLLNDKDGGVRNYTSGDDAKFKTDEFKRNDYVLVTIADDVVKTVEAAPTVESKISRYNKSGDKVTFTASGTQYVAAKNTAEDADLKAADDNADLNNNVVDGKTHTLYVDKYGYLLAVGEVEADGDYVYAAHFGTKADNSGDFDDENVAVKLYYADGTSKIVTLDTENDPKDTAEDGTNAFNGDDITTINNATDTGIYKLIMRSGKAILTKDGNGRDDGVTAGSHVRKGISGLVDTHIANGKTVFFYVSSMDPDSDWNKDDFTVKAYVGINSVRTSKSNAEIKSVIADAADTDGNTLAKAVLVHDTDEGEANDTVYLFTGTVQVDEENFVATYETYVKGQVEELKIQYETYDKMMDGVDDIKAFEGEFFTLNSKNAPITSKIAYTATDKEVVDGDKSEYDPKKIDKLFYDDALTVTAMNNFDFSVGSTEFAWSYNDTPVIDLTGNKDTIESGTLLRDIMNGDNTDWDDDSIRIAIQYQDNSSNTVEVIYVTAADLT